MEEINNGSSYDIFDSAINKAIYKYRDMNCYEDIYQECYCKILDVLKNNTYDPIYNLYGYAYSIARNTATQYIYHHKKLVPVEDEVLNAQLDDNIDFELDIFIEQCINDLMIQYKDVLGDRTLEYIKFLLHTEVSNLVDTVLKGELIWMLESYHNRER